MKQIISLNDLAKKLNKSPVTLYNWNRNNYLKFIKIGGRNYYTEEEIVKVLKINIYDNREKN